MSEKVVGSMSVTTGMMKDFWRQVADGSLIGVHFQAFLDHKNRIFVTTDIKSEWAKFYRKFFWINVDFSDVIIPENPGDFTRVIFIPKGLTIAQVVKAMRKRFKVSLYTEDLDKAVCENDRVANRDYAVRVRERVEADEELKNFSANQLKERGEVVITPPGRLVYEFKYWDETGKHLDVQNWTLCAGSRDSDDHVPFIGWYDVYDVLYVGIPLPFGCFFGNFYT